MIDVTYTVTQAEFVEAQKIWCPQQVRKLPGHWLLSAVLVVFGAVLGWSLKYLPIWLWITEFGLLLLTYGIQLWRRKMIRIHQYRTRTEQFQQVHVVFDDVGYHDEKSDSCGGWIAWEGFSGWRETSSIFILGRGLTFITVPKSGLTTDQQEELRTMLNLRVSK